MIPRILIIAGSDSGGGAGIQADIRTVTMLGGHPMTAITAITAQNTCGVDAVLPVPSEMIVAQIDAVIGDIGVDAVKIGMIGSADAVDAVAARLAGLAVPLVLDPVMVATSGARLADAATVAALGRLMALATVVTPNLPELDTLGGEAAVLGHGCLLAAKGGHGAGDMVIDRLIGPGGELARVEAPRIATRHSHGTGCTFAAALATGLGAGLSAERAFVRAVDFVRAALAAAPGLGRGHGPLGHALGAVPFDLIGRG